MKKLLSFILCTLLAVTLTVTAFAYDYSDSARTSLVNDFAQLIPDDDEITLNSKLEQISEIYECEVAILTVNSTDGQDITPFADDYYDYNGFGYGENDDGIMLVINMGTREFAITTHGTGIDIFTDYNLLQLENEFVGFLSGGQYTTAFVAFYEKCESIFKAYNDYTENYDGGYVYYPDDDEYDYYYNNDYYNNNYYYKETTADKLSRIFSIKYFVIAVVIGIIIAFFYTRHLKSQLKTVRSKASARDYVIPGSMQLTQQRDVYMYGNIKKTPKPKNNNSPGRSGGSSFGGGSSTHRSSSGRTHGGSRGRF